MRKVKMRKAIRALSNLPLVFPKVSGKVLSHANRCTSETKETGRHIVHMTRCNKMSGAPSLRSHFWDHTHLICTLVFHRANIDNSCANYYIKITGKCNICGSLFEGIIQEIPADGSR